jgi:2-keto-4-pentenoate hydratase/2-oxohepta-3-ene-1,7-dioic acid hydratase in catechol pathway
MAPHAVTGPYDEVPMPPDTERLDFELEIAAIVCRDVRNESPEEARSAIGGYCVMNDWSARDVQGKEMRLKLGPSKGKDFATTIGPWVVTADELDECRDADGFLDLRMTVRVNGEEIGSDRSGHMGWSFEQLVSHASRASWVKAGEVLASGTCATGSLAESWGRNGSLTPPPLQVGDVVEMSIERLGTIRNTVGPEEHNVAAVAPARRRSRLEASA